MKKVKKLLSLVLVICMMTSMFVIANVTSSAGTFVHMNSVQQKTIYPKCTTDSYFTVSFNVSYQKVFYSPPLVGYINISSVEADIDGIAATAIDWDSTTDGDWVEKIGHATFNYSDFKNMNGVYTATVKATVSNGLGTESASNTATFTVTNSHNFTSTNTGSTHKKSNATCTSPAVYYKSCSRCGANGTETFTSGSTIAHNYTSRNTGSTHRKLEATCTNAAVYYFSCSACGANGTETFESGSPLGHTWDEGTVTTQPTCSNTGVKTYMCTRDPAHTKTESIAAVGHVWNSGVIISQPTCTQTGVRMLTCTRDASHTMNESIDALGHDYSSQNTDNSHLKSAATCTEAAVYYKSCSRCGANGTETFTSGSALSHNAVTDAAVPATCTQTGLTAGTHCSICGVVLTAQEVVPATGHTVVEDAAVPATCTATGLTAGTHCSVCGVVLTAQQSVPATGHTVVEDAAVPATCTATGLTAGSHCSVCGVVLVTPQEVPATGHTAPAEWTVVTPATCTTAGLKEKRCTACDILLESEAIDALGHIVVEDAAVPATCTSTGLTAGSHCSRCDAVLVAQETTEALGHTIVEDAAVPATCTATGLTAGSHCSVCGVVFVTQQEVPATGHTPGTATTEKVDGVDKHVTRCTVCNTILYVEEIGSADYTAVNAAIAAANALTASEYYDISGVTAAVNAVERGLNADHQAEVDAMATAITSAIAALVPITSVLKLADAVATADGRIITVSPKADAESITVYPTLKNGNTITFANRTGGAKLSKSGSLYARSYGTATTTINGTVYTIILEMPDVEVVETSLVDNLKVDFATASVVGTTITLTPNTGAAYVSLYPTLKDGTVVTFGSRTGAAKLSSNGTLTARNYGTAKATIDGVEYTVILDMPEKVVPEKPVSDLIKTANATVAVDGTTITLTPKSESVQVSVYPTLKDSTVIEFTGRTGAAKISKSGTLYAKAYGTAKTTINNTEYTIVFNFAAPTTTVADLIKTANATVNVEGTTITLTATNPNTQISLYPTTKDGKTVTFSERVGAKVSKSGTCYAKQNASCTMTIDGTDYTVNFVFA